LPSNRLITFRVSSVNTESSSADIIEHHRNLPILALQVLKELHIPVMRGIAACREPRRMIERLCAESFENAR
jgi:hypothetical protein